MKTWGNVDEPEPVSGPKIISSSFPAFVSASTAPAAWQIQAVFLFLVITHADSETSLYKDGGQQHEEQEVEVRPECRCYVSHLLTLQRATYLPQFLHL